MVTGCGGNDAEADGCVGADAAGPSSSEDDEEVDDDEEEGRRLLDAGIGAGARSASGSSRLIILAIGGVGAGCLAVEVAAYRASLGPSGGGGSSICMCCAVRSSAAVGTSPKSMYREPAMLLWLMAPESAKMS